MKGQPPARKKAARPAGPDQRIQAAAICVGLAAITFAVFGQTLGHDFINSDDPQYVYENPVVRQGLTIKGIAWAFTTFDADNWHPLTWLSHILDCQIYRLNAGGHHLTSVLLHTATVLALFLVLREMTGAIWRSAFVAAVFAIHPLRVESVAWVAERKDVLSGLFFVLTIAAYVRYARRPPSMSRYGLVVLLFALGLMSKPMLVTLPLVLLMLDYWPLRRGKSAAKLALEKVPLLILSAASCVITIYAQAGAIQSTAAVPLALRFANSVLSYAVYLRQMVWPTGLALFYPYPQNGLPGWEVALAGIVLAGVSIIAWRERRSRPWLLVGWLWYLVMLVPVVGIVQVGSQTHADRYTYLPQIGIYVAVTWLMAELRWNRVAEGGLMAGVIAALMTGAWKQTGYWKNSETLWPRCLACTTGNWIAQLNYGTILLMEGKVDEAIDQYGEAVQSNPNYALARFNLGNALAQKGSFDDAIAEYQAALRLHPDYAPAEVNLGIALAKTGKVDDAIAEYKKALRLEPNFAEAHVNLAIALANKGSAADAVAEYEAALKIKPDDDMAQSNLGILLARSGRESEAIAHLRKAVELKPANPQFLNNLALMLATSADRSLRDGPKALELAQRANELTGGDSPAALHTLAAALAQNGRIQEALPTAQRALQLAESQSNTGLARQLEKEIQNMKTQSAAPSSAPVQ